MINVSIVEKKAFRTVGTKVWISGQDNELFATFWQESHENGNVDKLKQLSTDPSVNVTKSNIFGISRVEKDPNNRAFFFYIASESEEECSFEAYTIPAGKWAIFTNTEDTPMALFQEEMHAFMEWLPNSDYIHAAAPELEVYPAKQGSIVEFWLPVVEK